MHKIKLRWNKESISELTAKFVSLHKAFFLLSITLHAFIYVIYFRCFGEELR